MSKFTAINPTTFKTTLGEGLGADASVIVGGADPSKLTPNIKVGKWSDEAWVNLHHSATKVTATAKQEIIGDRPTLTVGDLKHQMWQLGEDVLEYSITFAAKPDKMYLELEIQESPGLRWLYQPFLTPDDIANGCKRHPRVEGSYAVYYEKTGDWVGGPQYGIGKFMHCFRWCVTDDNGQQAWCEPLKIDEHDGQRWMVIGLPKKWMEKAAYPVRAMGSGDTFGNANIGASTTARNGDLLVLQGYTGLSGSATAVAFYVTDGDGNNCTLGVYSGASNPLSLAEDTGEVTLTNNVAAWYSSNLDSPLTLVSGTTYYPAAYLEAWAGKVNYDSDTNVSDRVTDTYVAGTLPASISPTLTEGELYSIKVTYTPAATGGYMTTNTGYWT
ncbi:MAG: hypothetical protein GY832_11575 [Chloroflexi bacterium]|nr:hypothetical protein [Chloroflexota bacterium]